jgi:hypothetical protein
MTDSLPGMDPESFAAHIKKRLLSPNCIMCGKNQWGVETTSDGETPCVSYTDGHVRQPRRARCDRAKR